MTATAKTAKTKKAPVRKLALASRTRLGAARKTKRAPAITEATLTEALVGAIEVVAVTTGLDGDATMPAEQVGEVVQPKAKKLPTHKQAIAARAAELVRETGVDKATAEIQAEQWLELDAAATGGPQYRTGPKAPKVDPAKEAAALDLLTRPEGATLAELMTIGLTRAALRQHIQAIHASGHPVSFDRKSKRYHAQA